MLEPQFTLEVSHEVPRIPIQPGERWAASPEYPYYLMSTEGRVYRLLIRQNGRKGIIRPVRKGTGLKYYIEHRSGGRGWVSVRGVRYRCNQLYKSKGVSQLE